MSLAHHIVKLIGFGMRISANKIQEMGFKSHTILEPHPQVYEKALAWKAEQPDSNITIEFQSPLQLSERILGSKAGVDVDISKTFSLD